MSDEPKLTGKQRAFCEHYIACCFNATEAARRAGYTGNDATLNVLASQNLRKHKVRDYISQRTAEVAMSANEVLLRFSEQARGVQNEFLVSDGRGGIMHDLDAMQKAGYGHLIKTITRDAATGRITKVEFYDGQAALRDLGRYHKLFTDKTEIEHSGTIKTAPEKTDDELDAIINGSN